MTRTTNTPTTVLDEARNAIPGYRDATTAVDTIRHWMTTTTTAEDRSVVGAQASRELMAAAAAGKPLPDKVLDRIADYNRQEQIRVERSLFLRTLYDSALAAQKRILTGDISAAHQVLVDHLAELYADVNANRDVLENALDAETAIRTGNPDAFHAADELCERYARIRAAHLTLVTASGVDGLTSNHTVTCGQVPNPLDLEPYWHARRHNSLTAHGINRDDPRVADHIQWATAVPRSHESTRSGVWPTDRPRTAWLLTVAGTDPVAPTADQIADIRDLCETAVTPPRDIRVVDAALAARRTLDGTPTEPRYSTSHTTIQ